MPVRELFNRNHAHDRVGTSGILARELKLARVRHGVVEHCKVVDKVNSSATRVLGALQLKRRLGRKQLGFLVAFHQVASRSIRACQQGREQPNEQQRQQHSQFPLARLWLTQKGKEYGKRERERSTFICLYVVNSLSAVPRTPPPVSWKSKRGAVRVLDQLRIAIYLIDQGANSRAPHTVCPSHT